MPIGAKAAVVQQKYPASWSLAFKKFFHGFCRRRQRRSLCEITWKVAQLKLTHIYDRRATREVAKLQTGSQRSGLFDE